MLSPGDRFGGYVVDAVAGRGGFATVYRAHETAPAGRAVALKILGERDSDAARARLAREYDNARCAQHRHVVEMFDAGPGWLAMEMISGGCVVTLRAVADRLTALVQVASALDVVHGRGIVHCDVKPDNILVSQRFSDRGAVLVDFGNARSVVDTDASPAGPRPGCVTASLPYAAPELLAGRPVSAATDEYSLACTTVEMLSGSPPFHAATPLGLTAAQLRDPPPRLSHRIEWIPRAFDSILAKALAKRPEDRYQSCAEMMALIVRAVGR